MEGPSPAYIAASRQRMQALNPPFSPPPAVAGPAPPSLHPSPSTSPSPSPSPRPAPFGTRLHICKLSLAHLCMTAVRYYGSAFTAPLGGFSRPQYAVGPFLGIGGVPHPLPPAPSRRPLLPSLPTPAGGLPLSPSPFPRFTGAGERPLPLRENTSCACRHITYTRSSPPPLHGGGGS